MFLLAEAVSCFHSQLPTITLPFQDPTSWLKAASQWLHSWDKTLSLLEVCGILLCSSTEDQDVMGQSYSELALLKRCSRERQSMLIGALIQFW